MPTKSQAIVDFLGSLIPLYWHMGCDGFIYAARSLQDGTRIEPVDESSSEEECGLVRVRWHGYPGCESIIVGSDIATIALERYVRLHGVGAREELLPNSGSWPTTFTRRLAASSICPI